MKEKKKAAILFTGGKDSCLALMKAKQKNLDIKYLLTILPSSYDSWMWHKPSLNLLRAQAKALNIPVITQKSRTEKEKEVKDLEQLLRKVKNKVQCIITGGIASKYQKQRIEKIAKVLGFKILSPLWSKKSIEVWQECLDSNFKIILTKICCEGLSKQWLGKIINKKDFEKMKNLSKEYGFNLEFEGGDAETAVLDMPLFKKSIELETKIKSETDYRHFLIIKKIKLKEKKGKRINLCI